MRQRKWVSVLTVLLLLLQLLPGVTAPAGAMPLNPTDESKVPHYFGPNPNWANSPFTLPDAQVVITGDGSGATAEATVGANGAITAITVTNGGRGYSNAKVDIVGSGTGATAKVTIVKKGSVVEVRVDTPGTGYTAPTVTFSGGGPGSGAAATAYGGVEAVTVTNGGSGYSMPTVDFDMPDAPDGVQAKGHAEMDANGTITAVVVDDPGSGYSFAPKVVIRNGTIFAPLPLNEGGQLAAATATLSIQSIVLTEFGANYNQPPTVTISDPTGTGATATALIDDGVITEIILQKPGSGYLVPGIRKFVDTLPGLGPTAANNLGQYIPAAVPDTTTFPDDPSTPTNEGADYYEIAVVEYEEKMHSDLPPTKLRGYVQLATEVVPGTVPLANPDGSPILMPDGSQAVAVDKPHYLGPAIVAQKDRAVRITFYNLLPAGSGGDFFLPADSTIMGSGMGPMEMPEPVDQGSVTDEVRNPACSDKDPATGAKPESCFADNRATLHLHGGNTPWISDGTPHQWITPANESTPWPEGVSVVSVPDMVGPAATAAGIPDCSAPNDGCMTFYYTNQQSARLMFYHDHSWGITRLNVYAGEAAAYVITDETEQALLNSGVIPGPDATIPLVVQDRTFVPLDTQLYNQYDANGNVLSYGQDPTWDKSRWGDFGDLWYHHVYMPAQNPGAPGGMSSFGRWMYSPWFWPPQNAKHGPIPNPYYNMDPEGPDGMRGTADDWTTPLAVPCNLDDPATWQYQEDPWCEPPMIPGTPLISAGMEQFNDTPIVNGTAYPTVTLEPKAYRLRILNAANDRFWNLQWYVADPTTASTGLNAKGEVIGGTEVALKADEVAAAQLDPTVFPTPDLNLSPAGPDWIQIGNESGFLAKPAVVDGQQVTTWVADPTRFDYGLVDQHSLLLAPAERADAIVDFSQFAGQTLILYNDAPAAFPARIPSYDYYTGAPDLRPVGAPEILPGYGPNTRTIMQVKIAPSAPAPAFNLTKLQTGFGHNADGSGVFESGQPPIIVGQAAYNSAYGSNFVASGWCNAPSNPSARCDGFARISEQGGDLFKFDTLNGTQVSVKIEPKAIQDETSESNFDEFGRMTAVLGLEVVPATPGTANTVLYPYAFPLVDLFDTSGLPRADVKVTPISSGDDGTQIWKITHNGVDTHPIHFHGTDVQILNRVTWDNIIKPPQADELGWKETIRVSPLEDTYVAIRPIIPVLPFDFPNSVRLLSPMMPEGAWIANTTLAEQLGLPILGFAPSGEPIDIKNHYVNFGAEYVYHCHILSHEEMDMMHAVSYAFPPVAPGGLAFDPLTQTLSWTDNSLSETAFVVEKSTDGGTTWTQIGRIDRDLLAPANTGEVLSFADPSWVAGDQFRVVAQNTVGDTWDYSDPNLNEIAPGTYAFPVVAVEAVSQVVVTSPAPAAAPSDLTATQQEGPLVSLAWTDNSLDETGFVIQRSTDGLNFADLTTVAADTTSYLDAGVVAGNTYTYQVAALNGDVRSAYSNTASITVVAPPAPPAAPSNLNAIQPAAQQVSLAWVDNANNETGFVIERATDGVTFSVLTTVAADTSSYTDSTVTAGVTYTYQVAAVNDVGQSGYSNTASVAVIEPPAAPDQLEANLEDIPAVDLVWADNSLAETGFVIERSEDGINFSVLATVAADSTSYVDSAVSGGFTYTYRVAAVNGTVMSAYSNTASVFVPDFTTAPAAPSNLSATNLTQTSLTLNWQDNSNNETGFTIQRAENSSFTKNAVTFNVGANVTSFGDSGLKRNTKYYYRVQAYNMNFTSPWSPIFNVTTAK